MTAIRTAAATSPAMPVSRRRAQDASDGSLGAGAVGIPGASERAGLAVVVGVAPGLHLVRLLRELVQPAAVSALADGPLRPPLGQAEAPQHRDPARQADEVEAERAEVEAEELDPGAVDGEDRRDDRD